MHIQELTEVKQVEISGVRIAVNPSKRDLVALVNNSAYYALRGLDNGTDFIVWDAANGVHLAIANSYGWDYGKVLSLVIYTTRAHGTGVELEYGEYATELPSGLFAASYSFGNDYGNNQLGPRAARALQVSSV